MSSDIGNFKSFYGIRVEYFLYNVFVLGSYETRYDIVAGQDFFVEFVGVRIFKREIATSHGVENNSARPDVTCKAVVFFTCNHLWSCVAGTATSGLQSLVRCICITQTEVNNFNVVLLV